MEAWYALHTKPRKETAVYHLLKSREFTVFYPTVQVAPVNPRAARVRPYFPGYLFVHTDLQVIGRNALEWLPGSHGLVAFGGEPAVVPPHLVETIKAEAAGWHERQQEKNRFHPGQKVRVVHGPLAGYEGVFDVELSGRQRVQLLLTYLHNQPKLVQMDRSDIVKIE
jgi:transcription antitermination factor NusG